jgi:hypothetical protein
MNKGQDLLSAWLSRFNRSFAEPASEDLQAAKDALQLSSRALDPQILKMVQFSLRNW